MSLKLNEDSKVMSIRISSEMLTKVKGLAAEIGLSPSVYVRKMIYEKCNELPHQ